MPTALPARRLTLELVWRRHAPERETVRDVLAAVYECAMAVGLALSLVLIVSHFEMPHGTGPGARPATTQAPAP